MTSKPIIAVVGATGAQGGGLVRAILKDPSRTFAVRAITRHADSIEARKLSELGAEVVAANLDDGQTLARAFAGAHGAFCVTPFWEHFDANRELEQARRLSLAAQAASLRHVIWSTLEDTRRYMRLSDPRMPTLQGQYKVPHWDAKGEADAFFTGLGLPTTLLLTSFYWENLIHFGMHPRKREDGRWHFVLPMGTHPLPGVAVADIGQSALEVFRRGNALVGRTVGIAGEHLTGAQMASALGAALGRDVVHDDMTLKAYRSSGFPGAEDLANMFQFKREFSEVVCVNRNVAEARALNPGVMGFKDWLAANGHRIPTA